MNHYAGIDVSLECSSVCVVDTSGKILREARVPSEPEALIAWFHSLGFELERIGLEAGPLSQWFFAAMREAGLAVELLETRHVRKAFEAMPVKSDRNDARGIAQLMRLGAGTMDQVRPLPTRSLRKHANVDWPTYPLPTPSGGGLAPTPYRSETPASGQRKRD